MKHPVLGDAVILSRVRVVAVHLETHDGGLCLPPDRALAVAERLAEAVTS
jgi:hypothetical protein